MSTPTIPETHRAVTATTNPKGYKILEKPLPVVADDEIPPQHGLESGDVVYVGNNAEGKGVKLGDPVAGFTAAHRFDPANAAFQEYIKTRPESVFMVPTDKISYQQAAPFGVALSTSVQGLYEQLDLPWSWAPAKEAFPILVWGGFTAVGIYAIKLAKLSGLLGLIRTASPRNHGLLEEVGADVIFDYKDLEAPRLIREWSHGKITVALDTVSEEGSTQLTAQALGDKGGKIVTVLPAEPTRRAGVEAVFTMVTAKIMPEERKSFANLSDWYRRVPEYATQLNVVPIKVWEGGLEAAPEALDYMRAGKVSAQKIVLNVG